MTELRLFETPGDTVAEITTDGSTIKPFLNAASEVCREVRLEIETSGLFIRAMDASRVAMGEFWLDAAEFQQYDVAEERTIGLDLKEAKKLVRRARKGKSDELQLHVQEHELTAEVSRGYDNADVVSQGTMQLIDPDAIRGADELPEFETQSVTVDADPFTDALSYAMGAADHVELKAQAVNQHADALYLGGENDMRTEDVAITGIEVEESTEALYSENYMSGLLAALGQVDPRKLTLELATEFPLITEFQSDGLEVTYVVAPRIQHD